MGEETDIVEPMSSDDAVVAEHATAHEPSKDKSRKRKKLLYKSIRELMEFYLGDVNVNKTRYMYDHIQGQPFVYMDLSLFLTFNKMKHLTSSVEELAKAISSSEILQLSEDGTKVCRKTPILRKENEDECTIYVEQFGPDIDHDAIIKVFSEFGPVDYVSMPKFMSNNKNKGFAFVEFKNAESTKKALETFNARGFCLSPHMAPQELMSIKNFDPNKGKNQTEEPPKSQHKDKKIDENKVKAKKETRKRKTSENYEHSCNKKVKTNESEKDASLSECDQKHGEEVPNKNNELSDKTKEVPQEEKSTEQVKKRRKRNKSGDDITKHEDVKADPQSHSKKFKPNSEDGAEDCRAEHNSEKEEESDVPQSDNNCAEEETVKQKKNRKKKKVKKDKPSANSQGFKILSKKDWKQLRNKYLNMQKNTMRSLKQHLSYSARQGPIKLEKDCGEQLVPRTVIKVTLDEPVTNVQATKHDMRIHPEIKYVDATENSPFVYLRTSAPEFASVITQTKHWPNMELIQGDEETQYWMKMKMDRENKFISKRTKQNQRGRSKLLKKAEKFQGNHIAFDAL